MQLEGLLNYVKERKGRLGEIAVLLSIFFVGFAIRYLAHGPRIGPELDTWFHFRMVKYILNGGLPEIDALAYYPTGRDIHSIDLLGLPYFIAYTYRIAVLGGLTLMDYMVAFPAIFTSLAAIPLYFLTKEIFEEKTAFLTAMFWQTIPATLTRTHAGFVDKESIASVCIFLFLYLFFISLKFFDYKNLRTLLLPIFSGIFAAFGHWIWAGTIFFVIVLGLSIYIYTGIKKFSENEEKLYASTILFTIPFSLTRFLVQPKRFPLQAIFTYTETQLLFLASGIFIIMFLKNYTLKRYGEEYAKKASYGAIFSVFLITLTTGKLGQLVGGLVGLVRRGVEREKDRIGQTVAENLPPDFFGSGNNLLQRIVGGDWFSHFSVSMFLLPIGAFLVLKRLKEKRDFGTIFFTVLLSSALFAMRSDIRLSFVLTPPIAMVASYGIFGFLNVFSEKAKEFEKTLKNTRKEKLKYQTEKELNNLKMFKVFLILLLFWGAVTTTTTATAMLGSFHVDVPEPWYKAMTWIRENTEEDAVIISWWDYGYWIQGIGNRKTVVDGGNGGGLVYDLPITENLEYRGSTFHRDEDMALMFTSPEDDALKYIRPYVDYSKVPTYVLVSYEEFGKSSAINHIAQDGLYIFSQSIEKTGDKERDTKTLEEFITKNGIETYFAVDTGSSYLVWITGFANEGYDPEMKNKLLPKLLSFTTGYGEELKHFKLVYSDKWVYVLIYKVIP